MKTMLLVDALCSNYGRIYPVSVKVEYDDSRPVSEFVEAVRTEFFRRATAILHYTKVGGFEAAKVIFIKDLPERVCQQIMKKVVDGQFFVIAKNLLEMSNKYNEVQEQDGIKTTNAFGDWAIEGGWVLESASREFYRYNDTLCAYKDLLAAFGIDVDDYESTQMILTNLGFNRVSTSSH